MSIRYTDMWDIAKVYLSIKYHTTTYIIEKTSKPTDKWGDSGYTMIVFKDSIPLLKSDEVGGRHKINHEPKAWGKFLATLKPINNGQDNN